MLPALPSPLLPPGPGDPWAVILGTAQDGGHPQTGCYRPCCLPAWDDPSRGHLVAGMGIVEAESGAEGPRRRWLVEATPDLPQQLRWLDQVAPGLLAGVILTHAHMGHYTGLLHLGPEGMNVRGLPVFAMPRMRSFLAAHGPWSLLVERGCVELVPLEDGVRVPLSGTIAVVPFGVPHRDELSETVGLRIEGPRRTVAWLPDIDAWDGDRLERLLADVDVAWIDGTFWSAEELPHRDPTQIPHPPIATTLSLPIPDALRRRGRFVHLNHTNPALDPASAAARAIATAGFGVARDGEQVGL